MSVIGKVIALFGADTTEWSKGIGKVNSDLNKTKKNSDDFFKSLKKQFGDDSNFGNTLKLLKGGGAIAGIALLGDQLSQVSSKLLEIRNAKDELAQEEAIRQTAFNLPVVGGLVKFIKDLEELATGEQAIINQQNQDIAEQLRLQEIKKKYAEDMLLIQKELRDLEKSSTIALGIAQTNDSKEKIRLATELKKMEKQNAIKPLFDSAETNVAQTKTNNDNMAKQRRDASMREIDAEIADLRRDIRLNPGDGPRVKANEARIAALEASRSGVDTQFRNDLAANQTQYDKDFKDLQEKRKKIGSDINKTLDLEQQKALEELQRAYDSQTDAIIRQQQEIQHTLDIEALRKKGLDEQADQMAAIYEEQKALADNQKSFEDAARKLGLEAGSDEYNALSEQYEQLGDMISKQHDQRMQNITDEYAERRRQEEIDYANERQRRKNDFEGQFDNPQQKYIKELGRIKAAQLELGLDDETVQRAIQQANEQMRNDLKNQPEFQYQRNQDSVRRFQFGSAWQPNMADPTKDLIKVQRDAAKDAERTANATEEANELTKQLLEEIQVGGVD